MNCICILVSLRQSILCGYDNVTFFWGGGGGCLICLIVLVVKLLTGFEKVGPPVKDWNQCCHFGWSLRCSDIKGVGASTVQLAVYQ